MMAVESIAFSYDNSRSILNNITFSALEGSCYAILGNNGAGKSTLLKCLNRILRPKTGTVYLDGDDVKSLNGKNIARRMAYVEQHSEGGRLTVFDTVLLGRKPYIKLNPGKHDIEVAQRAIERLELSRFSMRYVDELSGGELQKVMLARALAQEPAVLLLDEPTSSLDIYNQYEVMRIIKDIAVRDNILVIVVIHDINLAVRYCDRFVFLKDGLVYACGGHEVITEQNIKNIYGIDVTIETVNGKKIIVPN